MLSELKDILERIQTGNFADSAKQQRADKMMKDLNDLVSKQQKLLDETFKAQARAGRPAARRGLQGEPAWRSPWISVNGMFMDAVRRRRRRTAKTASSRPRAMKIRSRPVRRPRQPAEGGSRTASSPKASSTLSASARASCSEQAAKPDRSLAHRRREPAEQFEDAGEAMNEAKEALGERRSRPRHPGAEPGARSIAQGRPVDGRADDGERRRPARPGPGQ